MGGYSRGAGNMTPVPYRESLRRAEEIAAEEQEDNRPAPEPGVGFNVYRLGDEGQAVALRYVPRRSINSVSLGVGWTEGT
jgi:hypothetical protein